MKHLKTLLSSACCLSICLAAFSSFGVTGAEAAGGISSDPNTKGLEKRDTYDVQMQYYDKAAKVLSYATVYIDDNSTYEDVNHIIDGLQQNLSSAAYNALLALGKIAFLEGETEWLGLRINTLTETVKSAFESLDTIDIEDLSNKVTARLTKDQTTGGISHYTALNIFNVAAAQADGKSITSNSQDRLQLAGFESPGSGIVVKTDDSISYVGLTHTNGVEFASESGESEGYYQGTVGLAKWDSPGDTCTEYLGDILTGKVNEQDGDHYVLTRHKSGDLHYTKVGRVPSFVADDSSVTTNAGHGAIVGKSSIYGFASAAPDTVPHKTAGGKIEWKVVDGGTATMDDASITTNSNGAASIRGFGNAGINAIPYKSDSGVEWADAGTVSGGQRKVVETDGYGIRFGFPVTVQGTDGDTEKTGYKIVFASAADSNVKVSTAESGGVITVTIGVYYK